MKILEVGQKVKIKREGYVDNGLTGIIESVNKDSSGKTFYIVKDVVYPKPITGDVFKFSGRVQLETCECEAVK